MSATYLILPEKRLIIERFTGPTGLEEIKNLLSRVFSDPLFDRTFHTLMDFTKAVLKTGLEEVALLCEFISSVAGGGSTAIIAAGPMGTALAMLISKGLSFFTPSEVFSTGEAALNFLGLDFSGIPDFASCRRHAAEGKMPGTGLAPAQDQG